MSLETRGGIFTNFDISSSAVYMSKSRVSETSAVRLLRSPTIKHFPSRLYFSSPDSISSKKSKFSALKIFELLGGI